MLEDPRGIIPEGVPPDYLERRQRAKQDRRNARRLALHNTLFWRGTLLVGVQIGVYAIGAGTLLGVLLDTKEAAIAGAIAGGIIGLAVGLYSIRDLPRRIR